MGILPVFIVNRVSVGSLGVVPGVMQILVIDAVCLFTLFDAMVNNCCVI